MIKCLVNPYLQLISKIYHIKAQGFSSSVHRPVISTNKTRWSSPLPTFSTAWSMKHMKYFKSRRIKNQKPNPTQWPAKQTWCSYLWSASEESQSTTTSAAACRGFMFSVGWQRQHIQTGNWTFWFHTSIALKANPVYCLAARFHTSFLKKHTTGGKKRWGIMMGLLWPDSEKDPLYY